MSNFASRKGGATLFLTILNPSSVADGFRTLFDALDSPDLHPNRSIKLQGSASGGDFRITKYDPYLLLIWLMNTTVVRDVLMAPVSFLSAWDINLACSPT